MPNDDYLIHYASKYYDPQEAHEYYEKHKHLKGRRSTSDLSEEGKSKWSFVKENITKEKKEKTEESTKNTNAEIDALRDEAAETKKRISAKLKMINDLVSATAKQKKEEISAERKQKLEQIKNTKMPNNLSPEQVIEWKQQKAAMMDAVRGEASKNSHVVTDAANDVKRGNREYSSEERASVSAEVKSAILAARSAQKLAKQDISEAYEDIFQEEFDKIKAENPKVLKPKPKKKSKKKSGNKGKKKRKEDSYEPPIRKQTSSKASASDSRASLLKEKNVI